MMRFRNAPSTRCEHCGGLIHFGAPREQVQGRVYHINCAFKVIEENRVRELQRVADAARKVA